MGANQEKKSDGCFPNASLKYDWFDCGTAMAVTTVFKYFTVECSERAPFECAITFGDKSIAMQCIFISPILFGYSFGNRLLLVTAEDVEIFRHTQFIAQQLSFDCKWRKGR